MTVVSVHRLGRVGVRDGTRSGVATVSDDLPLDRPAGEAPVDRSGADALARDYRARGTVRIGEQFSPGRVVAMVVVAVLVLVGLYYLATLVQVLHTGGSRGADGADAIIVMGAAQYDGRPSPQLAARLDHVVTLWGEGVAPLVVVTGGNIPGDRFTEAEASASYLVERRVPESAIVEDAGFDVDVAATPSSVVTGWSSFERSVKEAAGVALGRIIGFDRLTDLTG
jgi:hypothetical protein